MRLCPMVDAKVSTLSGGERRTTGWSQRSPSQRQALRCRGVIGQNLRSQEDDRRAARHALRQIDEGGRPGGGDAARGEDKFPLTLFGCELLLDSNSMGGAPRRQLRIVTPENNLTGYRRHLCRVA